MARQHLGWCRFKCSSDAWPRPLSGPAGVDLSQVTRYGELELSRFLDQRDGLGVRLKSCRSVVDGSDSPTFTLAFTGSAPCWLLLLNKGAKQAGCLRREEQGEGPPQPWRSSAAPLWS